MLRLISQIFKMFTRKRDKYSMESESESGSESSSVCMKNISYFESIDLLFKTQFRRLGQTIGEHPWYFLIIPILICAGLGSGLVNVNYVNDAEYLFTPINGQAKAERRVVEHYFPMNYSRFHPSRETKPGRFLGVIIQPRDKETLLRSEVWKEIKILDEIVKNTTIIFDGKSLSYSQMCASFEGECFTNDVIELVDIMAEIEAGNKTMTYPFMLNPVTFKSYIFPLVFGGIKLNNDSTIIEAVNVVQIIYFLEMNTPESDARGSIWESTVSATLDRIKDDWKYIRPARMTLAAMCEEIDGHAWLAVPYIGMTFPLLIIFTMASMSSTDWVRGKPLLGVAALIATVIGAIGGYGTIAHTGLPIISMVLAGLYLVVGIGIDDSFVMLAAWRKTRVNDPVPVRMGEAYSEAAMSITITSLTDMFSFWVGSAAPFHSVRIFCIYTSLAVVGTYLCHITIFGASMALGGYYESDNRHSLFFWKKISPKSLAKNKSWLYRTFFTGGQNPSDPSDTDNSKFASMIFFRDYWAAGINNPFVKALILILFTIYLIAAGFGVSQTMEGLSPDKLTIVGSETEKFWLTAIDYFQQLPHRVQIIVNGDIEYSNKIVRDRIEGMITQFENSRHGHHSSFLTESWLRQFTRYAERLESIDLALDLSDEPKFIQNLQENYLGPSSIFTNDVRFNPSNTKIIASRFIFQDSNVANDSQASEMLEDFHAIAAAHPDLNVTIANQYFVYFDQYLIIRATTVQSVTITCVVMMLVALVFIPNPLCALWIAFSILSIETGVLGFLVLWNVNLDSVSMLNLIMCIGFSVDFSAHISYAYISAQGTAEERVRESLYSLGMPIVQGAVSTVLGILSLYFAPSYILTTFFKSILLVMGIAAAHGLLLLPVLLSLFGPGDKKEGKGEVDVVAYVVNKKNFK